ncbi:MAG: histidine phosphatase family protein [Eubacterium sp.]|jgi:alpha-ribazole phosphatase|nr:histidine phosphatase family protein [Eubacterium sp.]
MINYTIYFIRHGITEGNLNGQYIGKTDLSLCDEGYAAIAGYKDSDFYPNVGRIYSSPLKRCVETAGIIYPGRHVEITEGLSECDFGDYEGKMPEEIEEDPAYIKWLKGGYDACPPGGESYGEFAVRCINALDAIFKDMMSEKITTAAVITHSGVIMNLLSGYGLPKGKPLEFALSQGEGFEIRMSTFLWGRGQAFEIIGKIF